MPVTYPYQITDIAVGYMNDRIASLDAFLLEMQTSIDTAVDSLGVLTTDGGSITANFDEVPPAPTIEVGRLPGDPPTDDYDLIAWPAEPSEVVTVPDLTPITVPDITEASNGLVVGFAWSEQYYSSQELTNLLADVELGMTAGTGIAEAIQNAVILNFYNKTEEQKSAEVAKLQEYFTVRSIDAPTGVLASQTAAIDSKYSRLRLEAERDITVEVMRLEHDYKKHCQLAMSKLQEVLVQYHSATQERSLQAETSNWDLQIKAFNTGVERLRSLTEYARLSVEAEVAYLDGVVKLEMLKSDVVMKRWEAYKIEYEAKILGYKTKFDGYIAQASGFSAYNNAVASMNNASSSVYEATAQVVISKAMAAVKAQEASINSVLKAAEVHAAALQASGQISSSAFAAALNSVNMGASISANQGVNTSTSYSHDETKTIEPGLVRSTSTNYNVSGPPA